MNKINYAILSVLMAISLSACAEDSVWYGDYSYEAFLGENVAGDMILMEYALSVTKDNCSIEIAGYQISESIICATKETKHQLEVRFVSFADGSIKNKYDVEMYPVDRVLFVLERDADQLVTTWGKLLPDESLALTGHYFTKQ